MKHVLAGPPQMMAPKKLSTAIRRALGLKPLRALIRWPCTFPEQRNRKGYYYEMHEVQL